MVFFGIFNMSIKEIQILLDWLPFWQCSIEIIWIILIIGVVRIIPYILDGLYEKYFG